MVLIVLNKREMAVRMRSKLNPVPCLCRDDAPVVPAQVPGIRPYRGLACRGRHGHRGPRAEDGGKEVKGHRGAAADGEGLQQRPADVCEGDHRAAAKEAGERFAAKLNQCEGVNKD